MLKIAICDDEEYFLMFEKRLISDYMNAHELNYQITSFTSGMELVEAVNELAHFDIIFLDIEMEGLNGLETAKEIRRLLQKTYLVFVTVHISYALAGYEVKAIRYLIKDSGNFDMAMQECMDAIICEMDYTERKQTFKFREGKKELDLENIMYIESAVHKLHFRVLQDAVPVTFTMNGKLNTIEALLQNSYFCRIHQSTLVNLKYVNRVERYKVEMRNGIRLNIVKDKYPAVHKAFLQYIGRI